MALRVRFQYQTGASLNYSIERLSDGLFWDFAAAGAGTGQTFTASPGSRLAPLPEDSGSFRGRYKVTLTATPAGQFADGDYCVTIHDAASGNSVVAELITSMHGGDDAPVFPMTSSAESLGNPDRRLLDRHLRQRARRQPRCAGVVAHGLFRLHGSR